MLILAVFLTGMNVCGWLYVLNRGMRLDTDWWLIANTGFLVGFIWFGVLRPVL